jgi:hypothetical protein
MIGYLLRPVKFLRLLSSGPVRRSVISQAREAYHATQAEKRGIATAQINEVVDPNTLTVVMENFRTQHGNVTYTELLYMCMVVKARLRPGENFLEIGTFDGNTISNISLNVPENSTCYTIDLPIGVQNLDDKYLGGDKDLVDSRGEKQLKHRGRKNVQQFYSDSTKFDYSQVNFSGAFIDGAHHYEGVKQDTENILRHIKRPGFVLWHDFYGYNEVAELLYEYARTHPIKRLAGTNICFLVLEAENRKP